MIGDGSEFLGPEHLIELGAFYERASAALGDSDDPQASQQERAQLACILLRLYRLRQLGPDQIQRTALRLLGRTIQLQNDGEPIADVRLRTAQRRAASVLDEA